METNMTELQKILGVIKAAYPRFEKNQMKVYSMMLSDIPAEPLKEAVAQVIKTSRFLPTIAEIRERAEEIIKEASGRVEATADLEWEKVYRAIGSVGPYFKVNFENPVTNAAVKSIGWRTLCGSDESAMPFLRQQFVRAWDKLNQRQMVKRRAQMSLRGGDVGMIVNGVLEKLESKKKAKALKEG